MKRLFVRLFMLAAVVAAWLPLEAASTNRLAAVPTTNMNAALRFIVGASDQEWTWSAYASNVWAFLKTDPTFTNSLGIGTLAVVTLTANDGNITTNFYATKILPHTLLEKRDTLTYAGGGTNVFLDWNSANAGQLTLTKNSHIIVTNWPAASTNAFTYNLDLIQDGTGNWTVTWDTHFKWAGGTAPTITAAGGSWDVVSIRQGPEQTNFAAVITQDFQ